jgi:hypothetical protein
MSSTGVTTPAITLWLSPAQESLGRAIIDALRARAWRGALRVGSAQAGGAMALATRLGADSAGDDLRAALAGAGAMAGAGNAAASGEACVFFLGSPGPFASLPDAAQRLADVDLIESARKRGVCVTSLEPLPGSLIQLMEISGETSAPPGYSSSAGVIASAGSEPRGATGRGGGGRGGLADADRLPLWVVQSPLSRWSASVRAARDVAEQLGPVRSMSIETIGPAWAGSLGARVFDAMDLAMLFLGEPESIDAAFDAPSEGGLRPTSGDTLRDLRGDLTANLRFGGGRSAAVYASSEAGLPRVRATLIAFKGRVTVGSGGFEWINADGTVVESPGAGAVGGVGAGGVAAGGRDGPAGIDALAQFASPIADQLLRLDSAGAEHDMRCGASAGNAATTLAMAQAALLSCRTGEAESPATMLKMAGG